MYSVLLAALSQRVCDLRYYCDVVMLWCFGAVMLL